MQEKQPPVWECQKFLCKFSQNLINQAFCKSLQKISGTPARIVLAVLCKIMAFRCILPPHLHEANFLNLAHFYILKAALHSSGKTRTYSFLIVTNSFHAPSRYKIRLYLNSSHMIRNATM